MKTRADVTVAIPSHLARTEVLELASLVLSHSEYRELCRAIEGTTASAGQPIDPVTQGSRSSARLTMAERRRTL